MGLTSRQTVLSFCWQTIANCGRFSASEQHWAWLLKSKFVRGEYLAEGFYLRSAQLGSKLDTVALLLYHPFSVSLWLLITHTSLPFGSPGVPISYS